MGVLFFLISMILIVFIIGRTLLFGDPVAGWPSMACILFLVSGVQLFCTGIVGIYLSKTYLETKHRPNRILLLRPKKIWTRNKAFQEKCIFHGVPEEADLAPRFF